MRGIDVISGNVIVIRHANQIEIRVRFLECVQESKVGSGQSVLETEDAFAPPGQMPFELKQASPTDVLTSATNMNEPRNRYARLFPPS